MEIMIIGREEGTDVKTVPMKSWFILTILFFCVLMLVGCESSDKGDIEGYYTSLTEEISAEYDYYMMDKKENDAIIYYGINYNESQNQYSGNIFCYNVKTKKSKLLTIDLKDTIQDFRVIHDKLYILSQNNASNYEIQSYDFSGNFLKKIAFEDYEIVLHAYDIYFWDVDKDENILIIDSENNLYVLENNKEKLVSKLTENILSAYISDSNQFIYLGSDNHGKNSVYQIDYKNDADKNILLNDQTVLENCLGIFQGAGEYVLINEDTTLYKLDINNKRIFPIFDWLDVNIDNSFLCSIEEKGGKYSICNRHRDEANDIFELIEVYFEYGSDDRKTIEIATIFSDQELKRRIVEFNKQHSDIRIHLRKYGDTENADERFRKMVNDLEAKSNIDIIITDTTYFQTLAERGILAELDSYIQESNIENKLISSVIDSYKINGKFYVIMDRFELYTVLGRKEIFDQDRTYTLSELTDILQKEGSAVYNRNTKSDILFDFLIMNDNYETFSKLSNLDLTNMLKVTDSASSEFATYEKDALMEKVVIKQDFYVWFELFRAGHDDNFSMIGYPCEENMGVGAMFDVPCLYGINTYSENKDEAWMFIQELLEDENQEEIANHFPINRDIFEEKLCSCSENVVIGEKVIYVTGDTQVEAILGEVLQEDIDKVRRCVYESNQYYYMDSDFFNIIREEAEAYYAGQKSAEEVISIINNRLNTYFNENM